MTTQQADQERAQLAAQLEAQRQRLEALVGHVPGVVWEAYGRPDAANQRIDFVSDYVETMLGYSVEEWLATPNFWLQIVHPDDRERAAAEGFAIFAGRKERGLSQFRWIAKDGRVVWVEAQSTVICDESGTPIGMRGVTMDISERKKAQELQRHLAAIVESSDDSIISETFDGTLTSWNPGAERLYGYRPEEVLGKPRSIIMPPERQDEFPAMLERLRRGEHIDYFETVRMRKGGRRIDVSVSMSPIRDAAGRIVGAAGIGRDITERKRVEHERARRLAREQKLHAEAAAAVRVRDEFLSVAAHELRTPLTSVSVAAQLLVKRLAEDRLDRDQVFRNVELIRQQTDKLGRLISQLLDIPRIEAGKLRLEREETDLRTLLEQAVAAAQARTTRHSISLLAPRSLRAFVDALRLEQVVTNLLDNALTYSLRGGPIEVTLSAPSRGQVEIAVRDHGVGIAPTKRKRLFERFYQAHAGRHSKGMGLGLYISRQIVDLHGGQLRAEFPEDGGSRFVVRLPRTKPAAAGQARRGKLQTARE